jgi:hypothetical protein
MMYSKYSTNLTLAAVLLLSTGCAMIDDEPDLSSTESEVVGSNKLGLNKLGLNSLDPQLLVSTPDGREVMSYIVSCAMPLGSEVTVQDLGGGSYTFPGWLNLAPAWATRTPTVSERRWVSACLLARTNVYATEVSISMRHDSNLALLSTSAERAQYTNAEGAFYGDLFTIPQTWYACSNRSWTPFAPDSLRMCALSSNGVTTDCTFSYAGACNKKCSDKTAPFGACKGGTTTYAEVITIFLTPTQQQGEPE